MPFEPGPTLDYARLGKYAVTNEPVYKGKSEKIAISRGFKTDLATSPRIFWALVPPFGVYEDATILHDWLCVQLYDYRQALLAYLQADPRTCPVLPDPPPINSVDTDGLFRRVMREGGVPFVTRWVMWAAVRWGALFSAHRRGGWLCWPEAPLVLLITVIELVVVIALAVGIHLVVDWIGL